ncbi:RING-box protein 2 [Eumeta japonica]|uniref:RING-box protein 2 n=1 Tax=Eumeta variegata TaxID=151549 RepID=A0A4C1VL52_EUMVA|nr:RING-box protein 2 [Eumeta japonica]
MSAADDDALDRGDSDGQKPDKMFTLKKWNAVAMWSWDVECDTCAICRVQVMAFQRISAIAKLMQPIYA